MTNLSELFADFEAVLDGIGSDCDFKPIERLRDAVQMDVENTSDGFHTACTCSLGRGGQMLEMSYLLAPVDEGKPTSHNFLLIIWEGERRLKDRAWHIDGDQFARPLGYHITESGGMVTARVECVSPRSS